MSNIVKSAATVKVFSYPTTPSVHSHAIGDFKKITQKLVDSDTYGNLQGTPGKFEEIAVNNLVPLDSQRETSAAWAGQRLISQNGFNWFAAGCLSVARDPDTKQNYVMDGCGRLLQAQLNGAPKTLPCYVFDLSPTEAAKWFAYNQSKGRRKLEAEEIFVNEAISGDSDAQLWEGRLKSLNLCITISEFTTIPADSKGFPQIRIRTLKDGFKHSGHNLLLMKQARDMLCRAYTAEGVREIKQDLYWGLIVFLKEIPDSQKNGFNKALQDFLNATAAYKKMSSHPFRDITDIKNNEAVSTFVGLANEFRDSPYAKPQHISAITKPKLNKIIDRLLKKSDDTIKEPTEAEVSRNDRLKKMLRTLGDDK